MYADANHGCARAPTLLLDVLLGPRALTGTSSSEAWEDVDWRARQMQAGNIARDKAPFTLDTAAAAPQVAAVTGPLQPQKYRARDRELDKDLIFITMPPGR